MQHKFNRNVLMSSSSRPGIGKHVASPSGLTMMLPAAGSLVPIRSPMDFLITTAYSVSWMPRCSQSRFINFISGHLLLLEHEGDVVGTQGYLIIDINVVVKSNHLFSIDIPECRKREELSRTISNEAQKIRFTTVTHWF